PPQRLDRGWTSLFVQVHDRFRVGRGPEPVPVIGQLSLQGPVIVDLSVEHDLLRAILVGDRLLPPCKIDDAQPAHPEAHGTRGVHAFIVGAAVADGRAHGPDHPRIHGPRGVAVDDSYDAAHSTAPSCCAGWRGGGGGGPVIASIAENRRLACARRLYSSFTERRTGRSPRRCWM